MVILHGPAHPIVNIKNTKQKHVVPIIFYEEKEAYARPFRNVYQIISYKFLHCSTFEEIEHNYLTRFSKYNFRQPPAFPTKKSFHHSGRIPVEFHWRHGKLLENDWNKWNLWNFSEIPLEFQQFIILTLLRFHL